MNTLSYGLLCLLATNNYTGYGLMLKIQPFWQAKHSQIYPLLAMLEKEGYVQYEEVVQSDKPDKKIYSITEKGQSVLKLWIAQPSADPISRDELMLKTYCASIVEVEVIQTLFDERELFYKGKLAEYRKYYEIVDQSIEGGIAQIDLSSMMFGFYLILKKAIMNAEVNIEWCQWVKRELTRVK